MYFIILFRVNQVFTFYHFIMIIIIMGNVYNIYIVHRIGIGYPDQKKHGRKQFIAYICSLDDSEPIWTGSYFSNLWHFFKLALIDC